jgi:hypothetical protein
MIAHHHHDAMASNFSISDVHDDDNEYKHHHEDRHQHHHDSEKEEKKKEHNHPFPFHHHISATSDFVSARTNIQESNPVNKISSLFGVSDIFHTDFFEPPILSSNRYWDKSFLISSNYYPAANSLRGPPSIV